MKIGIILILLLVIVPSARAFTVVPKPNFTVGQQAAYDSVYGTNTTQANANNCGQWTSGGAPQVPGAYGASQLPLRNNSAYLVILMGVKFSGEPSFLKVGLSSTFPAITTVEQITIDSTGGSSGNTGTISQIASPYMTNYTGNSKWAFLVTIPAAEADNLYLYAWASAGSSTFEAVGTPSNLSAGAYTTMVCAGQTYGYIFNSTFSVPPSAPVITGATQCATSPFTNVISWSAVSGALGYNLTINGAAPIPLGNVLTYTDAATIDNKTYSLTAFSGGGNSAASNILTLQCPHQNLGQALIGGDSGQTLSQGYFGSTAYSSTAKILWGVLAILTLGLALGMTVHPILGYGGAIVGIIACFAFGWFPLWILLFLIVVGGGATLVWANYGRSQE